MALIVTLGLATFLFTYSFVFTLEFIKSLFGRGK